MPPLPISGYATCFGVDTFPGTRTPTLKIDSDDSSQNLFIDSDSDSNRNCRFRRTPTLASTQTPQHCSEPYRLGTAPAPAPDKGNYPGYGSGSEQNVPAAPAPGKMYRLRLCIPGYITHNTCHTITSVLMSLMLLMLDRCTRRYANVTVCATVRILFRKKAIQPHPAKPIYRWCCRIRHSSKCH